MQCTFCLANCDPQTHMYGRQSTESNSLKIRPPCTQRVHNLSKSFNRYSFARKKFIRHPVNMPWLVKMSLSPYNMRYPRGRNPCQKQIIFSVVSFVYNISFTYLCFVRYTVYLVRISKYSKFKTKEIRCKYLSLELSFVQINIGSKR